MMGQEGLAWKLNTFIIIEMAVFFFMMTTGKNDGATALLL